MDYTYKELPAALSKFDSSSEALPGASDGEVLVFFQRKERNGDLDLERTLRRDSLLAGVGAEQTEQERTNSEHCRQGTELTTVETVTSIVSDCAQGKRKE